MDFIEIVEPICSATMGTWVDLIVTHFFHEKVAFPFVLMSIKKAMWTNFISYNMLILIVHDIHSDYMTNGM